MKLLRRYQLDIIFFFFALLIFIGLSFYGLEYLGIDPRDYEWFVAGPLIILYFAHLLQIRESISLHDRRAMTGKTLFYWISMGVILFASYQTPVSASDYWSINALFVIFTILLADSYWDFRKLTVKNILQRKEE